MESYIEDKKSLYASILKFLDESYEAHDEGNRKNFFENLKQIVKTQNIEDDTEEMYQFLEIIKSICEHHHRYQYFNEGVTQLLLHYKEQIKQTMSNSTIFHIFENNKKIVHFLLKNDIITISTEIYNYMTNKIESNGNRYFQFFIPELDTFKEDEQIQLFKTENTNILTNYEEKRESGENDSYICSLIREDSIEEFIAHLNRCNISPSSEISPSIFETNPFLIENKNTSLIEYSAFFGSIQIFRYLLMYKAELKPSLWLYAIHSNNAELIHLLESNEIPLPKSTDNEKEEEENLRANYEECLIESIKCHHNDIAYYIENNFIDQNEINSKQKEEMISNCIKYHNYSHFQNDIIIEYGFFYLNFYHYDKLFKHLLNKKEKQIEDQMNHEVDDIYYYLLKIEEISEGIFNNTKIEQIVIPSSVTSIGNNAFYKCSLLTQIAIPSSVISIGNDAFSGCSSLTQIAIPYSVTSIGNNAFSGCSSLKQITIPFSVTSIGNNAFYECSSLTQITILSSVTSIENYTFYFCKSLTQISIPSSVTSIRYNAFSKCSSLKQIIIPSSVTSIGNYAFYKCSSLKQIIIPSSVTEIGEYAFYECSSLTQIIIMSSVTEIGDYAFSKCSSVTQITIPSSVTEIGDYAFSGCSSLKQITIPSSVTEIGKNTFSKCSSLAQVTIPSSVTKIGDNAFQKCSSLAQIIIPSSVTKIGYSAFSECSSLKQISIPSSVTSVEYNAFNGCSSLTQISIPTSIDTKFLGLNPNTIINTI